MNTELLTSLQAAQEALAPQYRLLHTANSSLKRAVKLASAETLDAIAMHKHLTKLQEAAGPLDDPTLNAAVTAFAQQTQHGLDALAFEFARDLKEVFERRGQVVDGRPPTLVVDQLALQIDMAARKAQWFYGKEALTRAIPLSLGGIVKAYDRQQKSIVQRSTDMPTFLAELHQAWQEQVDKRQRPPAGKRINVVEVYGQLTLNRQTTRFWNSPSRRNFKDYERAHFVRDLVLAQAAPTMEVDGVIHHLRLGVATKSQADSPTRSIWLPQSGLDGEYYSDLTFMKE
ncbi:MAG: hypothetical protein U9R25_02870 [Chloroflexota bacterium]|nr:hypothetical protein [Chloroflexota bacterium]